MFKLSAYSKEACEIVEEFLSMHKLEYTTIYNPRGDFTTYFIYIDNEETGKLVIKSLEKYLKTKEEEREIELNERSW